MQLRAAQPTREKQRSRTESWLRAWREQKAQPERGWAGQEGGHEIWNEGKALGGMGESGMASEDKLAQPRFRTPEPGQCRGCPERKESRY